VRTSPVYFKNLNAIRVIAALFVFMQHAVLPALQHIQLEDLNAARLVSMITSGGTGVSIFFVLSGFLITYLIISEIEQVGRFDLRSFYMRRMLRIWPLYLSVVFFWFIIYGGAKYLMGMGGDIGSNLFMHLSFLSNFDVLTIYKEGRGLPAMYQNINWSVSIEEQFYMAWPLIFLLSKKKWIYLILTALIFSIGFRLVNATDPLINYLHTFSVMVDLVIGGLFAYAIKASTKIKILFESTNTLTHALFFGLTFIFLFFGTDFLGFFSNSLGRVITSILFGILITSQALTVNSSFLNLGNYKLLSKWGKYTYGIYLLHPVAIKFIDLVSRGVGFEHQQSYKTEFLFAFIVFLLTLIMSYLSFHFFELKFLSLKKKFQVISTSK